MGVSAGPFLSDRGELTVNGVAATVGSWSTGALTLYFTACARGAILSLLDRPELADLAWLASVDGWCTEKVSPSSRLQRTAFVAGCPFAETESRNQGPKGT